MDSVNERAVRRERRILGRAVRRGEQDASTIVAFEAKYPAIFGAAQPPIPPDEPRTPFCLSDGRPIDLRGLYRGGAVFIVLSGPSLLELDLKQLGRRGVVTFGVNNSPAVVRTNFFTCVDPVRKFHDAIWLDPHVIKFSPTRMLERQLNTKAADGKLVPLTRRIGDQHVPVRPCDCPGVLGYNRNANFDPARWLQETTINWGNSKNSARRNRNPRCLNTMLAVLKIAHTLGFSICYLLGADFRMDARQPYAFPQYKGPGGVASNNGGFETLNQMLGMLRPHFDAAGFRVFNCFERSGLTAFPFVPFDQAIKSATAGVPQDPLSTENWYEPKGPDDEQEEDE